MFLVGHCTKVVLLHASCQKTGYVVDGIDSVSTED